MAITQRDALVMRILKDWETTGNPPVPMDKISTKNLQDYADVAASYGYNDIVQKCKDEALTRGVMLSDTAINTVSRITPDTVIGFFTSMCKDLAAKLKSDGLIVCNTVKASWAEPDVAHCQYRLLVDAGTTNEDELDSTCEYIQYFCSNDFEYFENKFNTKIDMLFQHMQHSPELWISINANVNI